jgi:signal transduction histidine kinase
MFDLSEHNKGESGEHGAKSKDSEKKAEPFTQNMICCPSILAGMSREMRTQMNAIVAFSFLLNKKEYSNKEMEEFSNQIYSSCEQIISLFDNFLDSAIIDTGNSKTESEICNIDDYFNDLFSEFREILKQERYRDVIFMSECQTFNNSECLIDLSRLTRVIRNLFQNSLSNTKSGYIKVGYYFRDNKLTFFILDTGQEYLKCKEFLQSQDINQSLKRFNDTFTAINMVLIRKLIQMLNGSIWIECNGLKGSGIYFSVAVTASANIEDHVNKFSNTMSTI